MNRPALIRLLPDRLRVKAWARLYRGRHAQWLPLYDNASLRFAPGSSMELVPGDHISDCIAFTGVYELELSRRVSRLAREGGLLVDVGANLGYFALLWASANPRNKCIAFEASPRNVELLQRNINRNGFAAQVEVHPVAAGRAAGRLRFDPGPPEQRSWGGFASDGSVEVDVVRLDDVIRSNDPIALLKVDIEGADAWALMGCERLLRARAVREIWYEQNGPRMKLLGVPPETAADFLRSVGYEPTLEREISDGLAEWAAVPGAQSAPDALSPR